MQTGVTHSENFPVASWLCPAHLRPVVAAIYWFARTADDIADEGSATAAERLDDLGRYRTQLAQAIRWGTERPFDPQWHTVFAPLARHIRAHNLPVQLLHDLLSAFEQDVHRTASGQCYAHHGELLDYCRLSANPVGRLLLHLYGISEPQRLRQSDSICSALQLINFWQDLSVDLPRHRYYLPQAELARHGLTLGDFMPPPSPTPTNPPTSPTPASAAQLQRQQEQLVAELLTTARDTMAQGMALPLQVPGRAGWELRLVAQGGLRIADKIEAMQHRTWLTRPRLRHADLPVLVWRAWRMG